MKQSEQKASDSKLILNGRAALCAGRDDMSSEDEDQEAIHRFAKPDHFKTLLESGAIPDAAMIHEARKKRQKAREQGKRLIINQFKTKFNSIALCNRLIWSFFSRRRFHRIGREKGGQQ